jgi:hypothetical protein
VAGVGLIATGYNACQSNPLRALQTGNKIQIARGMASDLTGYTRFDIGFY